MEVVVLEIVKERNFAVSQHSFLHGEVRVVRNETASFHVGHVDICIAVVAR